jgi:hypothetical protein
MNKQYKVSITDTQTITASSEDEAIEIAKDTLDLANLDFDVEESNDKSKWSLTAEQQKELEKKDWEVIPQARYLDLYHDDFEGDTWQQVCEVFDKQNVADKLTLLVVGVKTNE